MEDASTQYIWVILKWGFLKWKKKAKVNYFVVWEFPILKTDQRIKGGRVFNKQVWNAKFTVSFQAGWIRKNALYQERDGLLEERAINLDSLYSA